MKQDYQVLQHLGRQIAQIAALPIQAEKKKLWTVNNDLAPVRPMVHIDQLPWHELNTTAEMQLQCQDPFLRQVEHSLRAKLYRWNHFPCDMVVENRVDIANEIHGLRYGIDIVDETLGAGDGNDVVSHRYEDQLQTDADLEKLQNDTIWVDDKLNQTHLDICNDIFHDIIPTHLSGVEIHCGVWDRIAQMRPADSIIWGIIDEPEFMEATVRKFVDLTMSTIDQCEALGLLDPTQQYVHCTGAYTNDLPKSETGKITSQNMWAFGMAQILSTVSPDMHEEFEIDLVKPLYERFGLMYYGCCEPLDRKIDIIRKIKNVRKISVSPWADIDRAADNIHGDYVFSCKSNPSFICAGTFQESAVRKQLEQALEACRRTNTPLEIILKDVSSLMGNLDFVDRWEKIAMEYALA